MHSSKILITGSTGFVGQNLLRSLTDFEIKTINRQQFDNICVKRLHNTSVFIHLAGKAHDLKKASNPQEYYQVNYELTKKIYDVFLQSSAKKFIFISSVKASADYVKNILTEESTPHPQTNYGKSKLMAEQYIQSQPLSKGKSFYILRPCMIHGPGNIGNLNLLYKFVQKGIPYPLAAFENKRSFLSIENLCFVIKQFIKKEIPSGIYNVADDEALSTNEIIQILANSSDTKVKLLKIPPILIKILTKVSDILKLPLNSERLQKLTENYMVSNAKIKTALNQELPVSAREGLLRTARSFSTSSVHQS